MSEKGIFHEFSTGAKRSEVKPRYDLIPTIFLERLACRYSMGAQKYGEHNWQKGLPLADTLNHILDHLENVKTLFVNLRRMDAPERFLMDFSAGIASGEVDDDLAGAAWGCATLMYFIHHGIYVEGREKAQHGVSIRPDSTGSEIRREGTQTQAVSEHSRHGESQFLRRSPSSSPDSSTGGAAAPGQFAQASTLLQQRSLLQNQIRLLQDHLAKVEISMRRENQL